MSTRRQTKAGSRQEVQQLMRVFAATYAHEMDSVANQLGLTRTQAVLLGEASEPGSIRELAERIGCDPSNLTGVVQRLGERELIVVEPDPSDRRVKRVALSKSGVDTVRRLNRGATRLFAAIDGASPDELAVISTVLHRALSDK
ncbi:MAG TPA: MarR family transcriptional regulator [Kribbella sp.]|nr:MarR family transcriptional regulator [Kribbella sp.]